MTNTVLVIRLLWLILGLAWLTTEIRLTRRGRDLVKFAVAHEAESETVMWLVFITSLAFAFLFKYWQWLPLPVPYLPRQCLAFVLVGGGLSLRFAAVGTLGWLFTTQVQIQSNHQLMTTGPYRTIRHPAYSGILLAFAGIGIAFGDIYALLALMIPSFIVIKSRVALEEQWLIRAFGDRYLAYCQHTRKLIPFVY